MKRVGVALVALALGLIPGAARALPLPQGTSAAQDEAGGTKPTRIKLAGNVAAAKLIDRTAPVYPPLARETRISGTVRLHAVIGRDGIVEQLQVISGHPLLVQSALDAVKKWRYAPTLLNGEPVEVDTTVDVIFALDEPTGPAKADAIDPQLRADVLHLLEVTHFRERTSESGKKVFEPMRPLLLSSLPATASREKIVDAYIAKLLGLLETEEFTDDVVAIYAKYFSDEDVKSITQFYTTPTGQRFNEVMGDFLSDVSKAGQKVAMDNMAGILRQLCHEYPELQDSPNFCADTAPNKKSESLR